MSALLDLFTMGAVTAGVLFVLAGVLGLLRFPDALTGSTRSPRRTTSGSG